MLRKRERTCNPFSTTTIARVFQPRCYFQNYRIRIDPPRWVYRARFSGDDVSNGIFGALIVKQADIRDPHRALYDVDDSSHVILVSQWQHSGEITFTDGHAKPAILLVNGRGRQPNGPRVPLTKFTVLPGRRHRFRLANAGGAGSCPITVLVDAHPLLLIALDGQPVEPRQVASITLAKGNLVSHFYMIIDRKEFSANLDWFEINSQQ